VADWTELSVADWTELSVADWTELTVADWTELTLPRQVSVTIAIKYFSKSFHRESNCATRRTVDTQTDRQTKRTGGQSHITKLMSFMPNFRMRLEVDFNKCGERV